MVVADSFPLPRRLHCPPTRPFLPHTHGFLLYCPSLPTIGTFPLASSLLPALASYVMEGGGGYIRILSIHRLIFLPNSGTNQRYAAEAWQLHFVMLTFLFPNSSAMF
jgi:hypothetical protein